MEYTEEDKIFLPKLHVLHVNKFFLDSLLLVNLYKNVIMANRTLKHIFSLFILICITLFLFNCPESHLDKPVITNIFSLSTHEIYLEWNHVPGAAYYDIYQGDSLKFTPKYAIRGGITECKYTINTLTSENKLYYFRVRAFADKSNSDYSDAKGIKTKLSPMELFAGDEDKHTANSIALKWKPVQDARNYELNYAVNINGQPAGNWSSNKIDNNINQNNDFLEYNIGGLQPNTYYFFKIKALTEDNESEYSEQVGINTRMGTPDISFTSLTNEIRLSWPPVTTLDYYMLYYNNTNSYTTAKYLGTFNKTQYVLSDLSPDTDYYFWIKVYNTENYSLLSPAFNKSTLLISPELFAGEEDKNTAKSIPIRWESVNGAGNYEINYAVKGANGQPTGDWTSITIDEKDADKNDGFLEYNIGGLQANTCYYFKLKAKNSKPNESDFSGLVEVTTRIESPVLSIISLTTETKLSWPQVNGADFYIAYYSTDNSFAEAIQSGEINTTQYIVKKLIPNTNYYFWVIAHNNSQNYSLPGSPVQGKTVTSSLTTDFRNPADPEISGISEYLYRVEKKDIKATVNTNDWETYKWYLNGELKSTNASFSFTVDWQWEVRTYELTVVVTRNGIPYSGRVRFTVK